MVRYVIASILIFPFLGFSGYAQRDIENKDIRIVRNKPALPPPAPRRPKPAKPKIRNHGVLLILTDPPIATVTIKNSNGKVVTQGESKDGELQIELPIGKYDVEVTAHQYYPYPRGKGILVSAARPQTVPAYLKATTGSMIIGPIDEDARVLIDGKKLSDLNIKFTVKKDEKQIALDDVAEGYHTLSITSPRIADWKRDRVLVEGGATSYITTTFELALVNINVKSEPGAEIYLDGMMAGKTSAAGELRIPEKKPGQHTIRAEKERFEPAQKTEAFGIGNAFVEVPLSRIKSSPEFSDYFQAGTSFWDAPKTWQVKNGKLIVKDSSEVGLRTGIYDDFKMIFDISFLNDKGAVWIIRARDKKNYYLFQLSGPKGANPKFFQSYIYQSGQQPRLLSSDRVVEDLTRPNDSYTITIEAKGSTIKHFIQLKSNPRAGSELFSTLTDSTLSYGAVGFGAIAGEEFIVYLVTVQPDDSKAR